MSRLPHEMGSIQHHTSVRMPNAGGVDSSAAANSANGINTVARVIVERDYRSGIGIKFMTDFPQPELGGRIDPAVFEKTIKDINTMFEEAEEFDCTTFCESCLGYLTANLIYLCTDTKYDKCLKKLTRFVEEQNQRVYMPRGLHITNPLERGLRCIEIVIVSDARS
ncbi:unnamed protein product [Orchesella dallaii]|uniref:Ras modification protein ERF4 n=1 Tax=Orchesella dallaii TaxID=48710 RepID=A0ABP1QZ23_9HEXA